MLPDRPFILESVTLMLENSGFPDPVFLTIVGDRNVSKNWVIREIFLNNLPIDLHDWGAMLTRFISAIYRRDSDASFVTSELQEMFSIRGGYHKNGQYYPSIMAEIGQLIEGHQRMMVDGSYSDSRGVGENQEQE